MRALELPIIAALTATLAFAAPASEAQSPGCDTSPVDETGHSGARIASRVSTDFISTGASRQDGRSSTIARWYEKYDRQIRRLLPTDSDMIIMTRDINQENERLKEWMLVTHKVERNYKRIAAIIRSMPLPEDAPDPDSFENFRRLSAEWYEDAADICHELVRPRAPAQTVEELDEQLSAVAQRADALEQTARLIADMDQGLRRKLKPGQSTFCVSPQTELR